MSFSVAVVRRFQCFGVGIKSPPLKKTRAPCIAGRPCGAYRALICAIYFALNPAANGLKGLNPERTHVSDLRVSDYL